MVPSIQADFMTQSLRLKKGASLTREALHSTFATLEKIAKKGGWNNLTPFNLTAKQLQKYVYVRNAASIDARTIQNEVGHIRRAIRGAGRVIDADTIFANKNLGVPSASRIGTGMAIPKKQYEEALQQASTRVDALMRLQDTLGLRMEEAIASRESLRSWTAVLKMGGCELTVSHGTKGGKIRAVYIHPENRQAAMEAIAVALAVTANGRVHFYAAAKNDASAKTLYGQELAKLGLKNDTSSHSLRRSFAVNNFTAYMRQGFDVKQALCRVSLDLGHGDRRGRYVWNSYIKNSLDEDILLLISKDPRQRLI